MQSLYIGVDGGATKVIVRVEDEQGRLLGQETGGPANIRISVPQTWESINTTLDAVLQRLNISHDDPAYSLHAGMGLAGCELPSAYQAFLAGSHRFKSLVVTTDAHTACLGAHQGKDGAIIIIGTGVVGYQIKNGKITKVGGWGFPNDDTGGGAWLGLEAVKLTLQWLDGRDPRTELAAAVYEYFSEDLDHMVDWANQANSTAFARVAPIVIQLAKDGEPAARQLLKQAAKAIDKIGYALDSAIEIQELPLPCSLIGGVAPFLVPYSR